LLYDCSQAAIPTDNVDEEYLEKPRRWHIADLRRFMFFIGPISSIFDYVTFFVMLYIFNAWHNPSLFQTGWFVESLLTQTVIVHVIRSRKIPFVQTLASKPLLLTSALTVLTGIAITFSPIAAQLHFVALPLLYWPVLLSIIITYIVLTQLMKTWYIKKFGFN
jgi:Mg2+-importing ATPase